MGPLAVDAKTFPVQGFKHVHFCCEDGHFNIGSIGIDLPLDPASSSHCRNWSFQQASFFQTWTLALSRNVNMLAGVTFGMMS